MFCLKSMMISRFTAPFCDVCNQFQWKRLIIWQPHSAFACFIFRQTAAEILDSFIIRVQSDMIFKCSKMNDVVLVLVSRHTPGDTLLCLWQYAANGIPDLVQKRLNTFRLCSNICINCFRRLAAKMILIPVLEFTSAFWTFPHEIFTSPSP